MRNAAQTREQREAEGYYEEFVEKFKPKKTTDDCYTPPVVYEAVRNWALKKYEIAPETRIIRPFYSGGDYKNENYDGDCVVIDNPPFSILSEIAMFYMANDVRFFLFAPALTLFSTARGQANYLPCYVKIVYENGAEVPTSFITNMGAWKIDVCPDLYETVKAANKANIKKTAPELPKYTYPPELITASKLNYLCEHGQAFHVATDEVCFVRALDAQRPKKVIFGTGFLTSERAAAERAAAERAAAYVFELSENERKIVEGLGNDARKPV